MQTNAIDIGKLRETREFECILDLQFRAKSWLERQTWCIEVIKSWYALGLYEKIGVFLFNIVPENDDVDDFVWVVVGDLPTVYIDKLITTPNDVLIEYCYLMQDWAEHVLKGLPLDECYPVIAPPSHENAELLLKRISFIRENFITPSSGEQD